LSNDEISRSQRENHDQKEFFHKRFVPGL
jgi:hypothetical protein